MNLHDLESLYKSSRLGSGLVLNGTDYSGLALAATLLCLYITIAILSGTVFVSPANAVAYLLLWVYHTTTKMLASSSAIFKKAFESQRLGILNGVQSELPSMGLSLLLKGSGGDAPPGLGNRDNSCYQNSVIQGLASLPSLYRFLSNSASRIGVQPSNSTNAALFDTITKLNDSTNSGRYLWTPAKLKSMSSWQQQDAQEYFSKIMDDVDKELMRASKGLSKSPGLSELNTDGPKSTSSLANGVSYSNILKNPLDGLLAQRVGCVLCGYSEGLSAIPFNCLTVPLGREVVYDVRDCLDDYTNLEYIEGVECAKCTLLKNQEKLQFLLQAGANTGSNMTENLRSSLTARLEAVNNALEAQDFTDQTLIKKCAIPKKVWVTSTKSRQAVIARAPKCLTIHINRSVFNEYTGAQTKNLAQVQFPKDLDLGPWSLGSYNHGIHDASDTEEGWSLDPTQSMLRESSLETVSSLRYALRAVVTHFGRHENGHYICFRKHRAAVNPSDIQDFDKSNPQDFESWWRLSDEDVSKVSEEMVLRQGGVFMLFYERSDFSTPNTGNSTSPTIDNAQEFSKRNGTLLSEGNSLNETIGIPIPAIISNPENSPESLAKPKHCSLSSSIIDATYSDPGLESQGLDSEVEGPPSTIITSDDDSEIDSEAFEKEPTGATYVAVPGPLRTAVDSSHRRDSLSSLPMVTAL